jgi:Uma2 family endonuclease
MSMPTHREARRVTSRPPEAPPFPLDADVWPFAGLPMPLIYEDEGQEEMGDATLHTDTSEILHVGLNAHFGPQKRFRVFANLNCYYSPDDLRAYFSADVMVVEPFELLPVELTSYRIGEHGPAPRLTVEILSQRSGQQRDLTDKPIIYGRLRVAEYILADLGGEFLPERLQLRRRRRNGTWRLMQDAGGGVTSQLGFRIIIDADNRFRVINAATGERYLRPDEAQAAEKERQKEARARKRAEKRVRELEAELERLRNQPPGS